MRKVLIFSTSRDVTTGKVMAWMDTLDSSVHMIRINDTDSNNIPTFSIDEKRCSLNFKGQSVEMDKEVQIWYRNGTLFENTFTTDSLIANQRFNSEFNGYLDFLSYFLESNFKILGSIIVEKYLSKLIALDKARKVGLLTPKYFLSNNDTIPKASFEYIIKSIGNIQPFLIGSFKFIPDYKKYNDSKPDQPSLCYVQEYIEKQFEIRSFFFNNQFYSMAIFSQQSPKTKIDYRNYDEQKPNRKVPFKLPVEISEKLANLMGQLGLNTGSIDLIVSRDHKFYFLEVNPCGQIDWLSISCNYYLEKKVAKYLLK